MPYVRQVENLSRVTFSVPPSIIDRGILTPDALEFLTLLHARFEDRRRKLIARRSLVQREIDMGILPEFNESTRHIRERIWSVRSIPADLIDRRVEIMSPAGNAGMMLDALNSGANVVVGDLEDSQSPTWLNMLEGQRNLRDAVRREMTCITPEGRISTAGRSSPTLMVRPRGWHLAEKHCSVDGEPVSASLFDFGLFMFHNARTLVDRGTGAYFYLPKVENRFEAALWNEVFAFSEECLGLPASTVRATVLIESVPAAFEMDEILHELRDRSAGLTAGRWDYIFSFIKVFRNHPAYIMPDRRSISVGNAFLEAFCTLLIQTCHRRGVHAIAGMAARALRAGGPATTGSGLDRFRLEKAREAAAGYDGTWVGRPDLVPTAMEAFDDRLRSPNQLGVMRFDVAVGRDDLLTVPEGTVSEAAVRANVEIGIRYLEAWLTGTGTVALEHEMEDTAAAEVCRAQLWQWLRHGVPMDDGNLLTPSRFRKYFAEELDKIAVSVGPERYRRGQFELASRLFFNLVHEPEFTPFLTLKAYQYL